MKMNKLENLIWIIFLSIGILFMIIGSIVCVGAFNKEGKIKTTGIIEEIDRQYDRLDNNYRYNVWISFEVNGEEQIARVNSYSSGFYEGKEIEIYYNEKNPNEISISSLEPLFLIFPGIGLLFAIIGGIGLLVKITKRNKEIKLRENGDIIYGTYVETEVNISYSVNGLHPYNIICKWNDLEDGKTYTFKSKNIWKNPEEKIEKNNITTFPIYIDLTNKKKYIIDTDCLTEYSDNLE